MGIKQLNKYWNKIHESSIKKINLEKLQNSKVAIDFNLYLYRFLMSKNYLESLFNQILKLLKHKITPIYVFDGKKPKEKKELLIQRKDKKIKANEKLKELTDLLEKIRKYQELKKSNDNEFEKIKKLLVNDIDKLKKKVIFIKQEYIEQSKKLFDLLKIPYLQAENEAEQYCSQLVNNNIADYCLTDDMDVFPCGSTKVLRNFKFNSNIIYRYNLEEFLNFTEITQIQFINLCILLGCDYMNISLKHKYKKIDLIINFIKENDIGNDNIEKLLIITNDINILKFKKVQEIFKESLQTLNVIKLHELKNYTSLSYYYNKEILYDMLITFYKKNNMNTNKLQQKVNSFFNYVKKIKYNGNNISNSIMCTNFFN